MDVKKNLVNKESGNAGKFETKKSDLWIICYLKKKKKPIKYDEWKYWNKEHHKQVFWMMSNNIFVNKCHQMHKNASSIHLMVFFLKILINILFQSKLNNFLYLFYNIVTRRIIRK